MSENILETIDDRINKKTVAIGADQKSIASLDAQIALYSASKDKKMASIEQKRGEIEEMKVLRDRALYLKAKTEDILEYTNGLRAKFDAYEWRPDMPWEEKIESTDYKAKTEERFAYVAEMDEILKKVNKIYYRR